MREREGSEREREKRWLIELNAHLRSNHRSKNGDLNVHNSRWEKHIKKKELCRSRLRTASHVKARKREGEKKNKRGKKGEARRNCPSHTHTKKKRFSDLRVSGAIKRETKNVSAKKENKKRKRRLHFFFFLIIFFFKWQHDTYITA